MVAKKKRVIIFEVFKMDIGHFGTKMESLSETVAIQMVRWMVSG
jgi:hypothetical protein